MAALLGTSPTAAQVAEAEERDAWFQTAIDCADDSALDWNLDALRALDVPKYINQQDGGEHGCFPCAALHYAARWGNYEMARFLLERGAWPGPDVSEPMSEVRWQTEPEGIARQYGHKDVADLISHVREAGGWNNYINTPPAQIGARQAELDQRFS